MYCPDCGQVVNPDAAFCSSCGKKLSDVQSISQYFQIGSYVLGANLPYSAGMAEFSHAEYKTMGRNFRGERDYIGRPVTFLSREWKLMLGTVNGQLYKIALCFESLKEWAAIALADDAYRYWTTAFGPPTTQAVGVFTWDAHDGNVIIQMSEFGGIYAVNLFLTSSCVRNFR